MSVNPILILSPILVFSPDDVISQQFYDTTFVVSEATLHFGSGSSELSPEDSSILIDLFDFAREFDSTLVIIKAHTDSDGTEDFNLELSKNRAEVVAEFYKTVAMDSMTYRIEFYGESQPLGLNNSELGKAQNRRVEVLLLAKKRMTWLSGQLLDDSTNLPVVAQLFLFAEHFNDSTWSDSLGNYRLSTPIKEEVVIEVRSEDYLPQFISVEIKPIITSKPIDIKVSTASVGKNFTLLNLNFFGDQSRPLPGSRKTLDVVGRFLKRKKDVCVEVQGHINDPTPGDVA